MNFQISQKFLKIARSLAIIGGTGALIVGATMAASPVGTASLTGNAFTASTNAEATGGVQIAADNSGTAGSFSGTLTGFDFGTLTTSSTPTHQHFWLKNNTTGAITLTAAASNLTGFTNLDQTKAIVHIEKTGTTTDDSNSLSSLLSTSATLSNPPAMGASQEYDVWVTLDSGAVTSGTSTNGTFDLGFTGTSSP
jgi:hypothetical protein